MKLQFVPHGLLKLHICLSLLGRVIPRSEWHMKDERLDGVHYVGHLLTTLSTTQLPRCSALLSGALLGFFTTQQDCMSRRNSLCRNSAGTTQLNETPQLLGVSVQGPTRT